MNLFNLHLRSATRHERIDHVASFIGADASGSFGVLAGHARMIARLGFGLMRYRRLDADWEYVAVPGGVVYFVDNELQVLTRRYLRDTDYGRIAAALVGQFEAEEASLRALKEGLARVEREMLKRLWDMERHEGHLV
jgi:F-type H+-transporting ATPase subunit epsilon